MATTGRSTGTAAGRASTTRYWSPREDSVLENTVAALARVAARKFGITLNGWIDGDTIRAIETALAPLGVTDIQTIARIAAEVVPVFGGRNELYREALRGWFQGVAQKIEQERTHAPGSATSPREQAQWVGTIADQVQVTKTDPAKPQAVSPARNLGFLDAISGLVEGLSDAEGRVCTDLFIADLGSLGEEERAELLSGLGALKTTDVTGRTLRNIYSLQSADHPDEARKARIECLKMAARSSSAPHAITIMVRQIRDQLESLLPVQETEAKLDALIEKRRGRALVRGSMDKTLDQRLEEVRVREERSAFWDRFRPSALYAKYCDWRDRRRAARSQNTP